MHPQDLETEEAEPRPERSGDRHLPPAPKRIDPGFTSKGRPEHRNSASGPEEQGAGGGLQQRDDEKRSCQPERRKKPEAAQPGSKRRSKEVERVHPGDQPRPAANQPPWQ